MTVCGNSQAEDASGWNADVKQLWQDMGCCASSNHGNRAVPRLVRGMDHASAMPGVLCSHGRCSCLRIRMQASGASVCRATSGSLKWLSQVWGGPVK